MSDQRLATARAGIVAAIESLSGDSIPAGEAETSFLELGYDSLLLTQLAQQLRKRFAIPLSFRQLSGELCSLAALGAHIAAALPEPAMAAPAPVAAPMPAPAPAIAAAPALAPAAIAGDAQVATLMQDQLNAMGRLMQAQLDTLRGIGATAPSSSIGATASSSGTGATSPSSGSGATAPSDASLATTPAPPAAAPATEMVNRFARFAPGRQRVTLGEITPAQRVFIDALAERQAVRMPGSRRGTDRHRAVLADPRAAHGFRPEWKALVYPIIVEQAQGATLRDIDGNTYIDLVNGYGATAFGHNPDFVVDAVAAQLRAGFPIGPQADLAGEVAAMIAAMTGNERVSFTCTGSEAVMAALRLARAVTMRKRVVSFAGAYHGGFDEVIVRGQRLGGEPVGAPAAAGVTEEAVANMTVLEYGGQDTLDWIDAHGAELAAVLVEPVQSRHPGHQPREFLHKLREITARHGTALIFDEVVTGFRSHPGGAQALFGIRADLATYGKVLGGGLPIGIVAGAARFMDALDGGTWTYGDDSGPETDVTVFAGTFVRHPLALAAAKAVLLHLRAQGAALHEALEARCAGLVGRINAMLERRGIAARAEFFGSMFHLSLAGEDRRAALLPYLMREHGVHFQDGFPCFLTTVHGDAECDAVLHAFDQSLGALQSVGILGEAGAAPSSGIVEAPLTEPQMEVWLAQQMGDAASCAFNESVCLTLEGPLDAAKLGAALATAVARRDALRARFAPDGTMMRILPHAPVPLPVEDADQDSLAAALDAEARTAFDLEQGPPFRARLLRLALERHVLVFTAHHIICDGWSLNLLVQDIAAFYDGTAALPLAPAFATIAAVQDDGAAAASEAYWRTRFATLPETLELPTDRPRPAIKSFAGATFSTAIDQRLYQAACRAGARQGCTAFVTLLTAFQVLMGRLAGQEEVVVGVPMAGQALPGQEGLVGHCVNFLPIRAEWQAATTIAEQLSATRGAVLDAQEHQRCTLGTIVRSLGVPRGPNRLPLTDVQFNLERLSEPAAFGGLRAHLAPNAKAFVNFDLFFNLSENAQGLRLDIDYATDLFDEATVARFAGHYTRLLQAFADDVAAPVALAPLLRAAERQALLVDLGRPAVPLPPVQGVHSLFQARVAISPDAIAATCGGTSWTYRALNDRAEFLAGHLAAHLPLGDHRVGLLMQRSLDMLAALLAVSKSGHAYVPLDPHHPPSRLRAIMRQAGIAALFTDAESAPPEVDAPIILVEPEMEVPALAAAAPMPAMFDRPAYVIFTSGSTGVPKGVEVGQRALVNQLLSMAKAPGFDSHDIVLATTIITFDIAMIELFLPLITGGQVVIADRATTLDGFALMGLLESSGATVMQATPSGWTMLLAAGFRGGPRLKLLCGGEALPRALADQLMAGGSPLWNLYGPTETTIWCSCGRVAPTGPITIGEPVANTRLYVLDARDEVAPVGVVGELVIGGIGVARGYVGDPEQTAAKFIPDPFAADGSRMYRSGDRARRLADGSIEVLGRGDGQVKLRGHRIELGEIEAALRRQPGIAEAAVLLRTDPGRAPRLVAYVAGPGAAATEALRGALGGVLPDYMVPAAFIALEHLPHTANGKVDRRALPPPPEGAETARVAPVPLANERQRTLGAIWEEVLGIRPIGAADDILALGADSIQLFQIVARARRGGIHVAAQDMLRRRTIGALDAHLSTAAVKQPSQARLLPRLSDFRRKANQP